MSQQFAQDYSKRVVTEILELIEKTQEMPWESPYLMSDVPSNFQLKPYRGFNAIYLWLKQRVHPEMKNVWITGKQVHTFKGKLKADAYARGSAQIIFWKLILVKAKDENGNPIFEDGKPKMVKIPLMKNYTVYNLSYCDLPEKITEKLLPKPKMGSNPIEEAEKIITNMPKKPTILSDENVCIGSYNKTTDVVACPTLQHCVNEDHYYSVIFHELGHSTEHPSRLGRSKGRAFEECVAEFCSSLLCCQAGITKKCVIENHAAYIKNWASVFKEDPSILIAASQEAQKAADFILGKSYTKDDEDEE